MTTSKNEYLETGYEKARGSGKKGLFSASKKGDLDKSQQEPFF